MGQQDRQEFQVVSDLLETLDLQGQLAAPEIQVSPACLDPLGPVE